MTYRHDMQARPDMSISLIGPPTNLKEYFIRTWHHQRGNDRDPYDPTLEYYRSFRKVQDRTYAIDITANEYGDPAAQHMFWFFFHGVILMYDVSSVQSLYTTERMYSFIASRPEQPGQYIFGHLNPPLEKLPVILVPCNHSPSLPVEITQEQIVEFTQRHPEVVWTPTVIPRTGENIDAAVDPLLRWIHNLIVQEELQKAHTSHVDKPQQPVLNLESTTVQAKNSWFSRLLTKMC